MLLLPNVFAGDGDVSSESQLLAAKLAKNADTDSLSSSPPPLVQIAQSEGTSKQSFSMFKVTSLYSVSDIGSIHAITRGLK